jgi:signal transduction histidine kinase/ligand-binding sensor domain-containing protein/DNA-binding response OmpR family regulator
MTKVHSVSCLTLFFFLNCFFVLRAQQLSSFPNIQYITSEDGLSQSEVTCILQDRQGFLWIGTRGGLNRYDGTDFKVFQNEIGNSNSLINNSIESLFEDSQGHLWIGTKSNGVSCYQPEYDRFENFQYNAQDSNSISGNRVVAIAESIKREIWLGTRENGLNILNREKGTYQHLLGQLAVNNIIQSSDGNMWLATGSGLYLFSADGQQLGYYPGPDRPMQFTDLVQDQNSGHLYLGTWNQGVYVFHPKTESFHPFPSQNYNPGDISIKNAYHLSQDQKGRIWVGSWGQSLHLIDPATETFTRFILTNGEIRGGKELYQDVLFVYQDRSDIIWVGTNGGGLCKIEESINQFGGRQYTGLTSSLPKEPIWSIMKDSEERLWVGAKGNKDLYYSKDGSPFSKLSMPDFQTMNFAMKAGVRTLLESQDGTIWAGTNYSLVKFLKTGNTLSPQIVRIEEEGASAPVRLPQTSALYQTSDGTFWIGTQQNGLRRSLQADLPDQVSFRVYRKNQKAGGLKSNRISALLEDNTGRFWVGTYNGLHLYRPISDDFLHLSKKQGDIRSLSSDIIICLHEDKQGNLWVGTPNGLNLIIPGLNQSWTIECFQEKDGLPNNYIHSILEDEQGNLWIATNKGISKFNVEGRIFSNYDANDGLHSNTYMEGVAFQDDSGTFFFGGINGLNIFHPDSIQDDEVPAPMVLTGFQVFDQDILAGQPFEDKVLLEKSIEYSQEISLTHRENVFSINYASLDFSSPSRHSYMYIMEGLDESWRFAGPQKSVTYTNLSPGNYTFKVKASSNRKIVNDSVATLQIEILPPFWITWQAYLLYTLVFVGLLLLYRHFIHLQSDLRNKLKLSKIEKEKEVELAEIKTRFFTNITHELRSPLTLITGPVEEILEEHKVEGKLKQYLVTIHHHSQRLLGLVNQLLDFRKAESGNMKIQAAEGDFVKFAEEVFLSFRDLAAQKEIDFQFEAETQEIPLYFDRDKMEIVLCNLLSNAFKYTPAGRNISLLLRQVHASEEEAASKFPEGYCEILVKDTGKGMPAALVEKIFDRFYQLANTDSIKMVGTGIGLSLVKNIVDLHSGEVRVQSEIDQGSTFAVCLPFGKAHFREEQLISDFKNSEHFSHYRPERILAPPQLSAAHQVDEAPRQLLIVEDNPDIRSFTISIFEKEFSILEAHNGLEGLNLAKEHLPDLIISDVIMPEMDGLSFCKNIKEEEKTAHIPIILLTARTSTVFQVEGYHSGADAYVTKPFNPAVLKAQVNSILDARKTLKEFFGKTVTLQPTDVEISSLDEQFLNKAMKIVEDHIDSEALSRDFLAQALAMSPSTLYRKLKALTGLTTNAFIRSVRLKRAAQMIQQRQYNISEVAYQVGFNDLKYFRNCFKDQFGMTPSQFIEDSVPTE